MSEYHGKMMNIQVDIKKVMDVEREENSRMIAYKLGHRDARHDAAEIAIKADIEIARLNGQLQTAREALRTITKIDELSGPADDLVALCRDVATETLEETEG